MNLGLSSAKASSKDADRTIATQPAANSFLIIPATNGPPRQCSLAPFREISGCGHAEGTEHDRPRHDAHEDQYGEHAEPQPSALGLGDGIREPRDPP